ncbi:hybrid sensor histidine kinase/response regulator [bacterium]|nr:hybrid sensor histidine kinase/response regulator [bacterium]
MQTNYRVLIVDDIPHNVEILETSLEDKYVLETASSGEEALEKIPKFRPDLILLDIMMPGIDGYEVCRRIKADDNLSYIKIILVTGKALVEERLKGYEVGADDYVTKPFVIRELEAKIKVFLNLKRSREIDQLKTDLLILFAHETRTPLNGIIGGSDLLMLDDSLDESVKQTVHLISESGKRLLDFIDKTMFLCELKSAPDLKRNQQSISFILNGIKTKLAKEAEDKHITLQFGNENEDVVFVADWVKIEKAIHYIVDNAIKYSKKDQEVLVTWEKNDQFVSLKIKDEGEGIPPNWIDKIFDEFAVKDIVHHQKGQGLSLAISKHILESHGGNITVISEPDKGSTFTLKIPIS